MSQENTFHLGLTMAGAVSAGCYTAGVLDYLFEVLDLWERAKQGKVKDLDEKLIPPHHVVIDAMGGASAGGMATIMASIYALQGKVNPVKNIPKNPLDNFNILYDSWVHLDDDNTGSQQDKFSFEKLWETDDLIGAAAKVQSIFNTKVIDKIAGNAFKFEDNYELSQQVKQLPSYISKDLEVLLSHTLLRGIPLTVGFTTLGKRKRNAPEHTTYEHYLVSHFKLNQGKAVERDKYLWLNPFQKEYADRMRLSTISTGAFPIGLRFRKFDENQFSDAYIKAATRRLISGNFGVDNPSTDVKLDIDQENFDSITIDGGTINNEPYREVASILKARHKQKDQDNGYQNFGIIMIDPFPNNHKEKKDRPKLDDVVDIVPKIIGTLLDQSRVKRQEIIDQFSDDYYRGIIYPSKYRVEETKLDNGKIERQTKGPLEYPIACSSFQAFGGFLDVNFRLHDFFLGRDNARNYIRQWFGMPYDPDNGVVHPIHKNWTPEAIKRFMVTKSNINYLPVIPDLNMILDGIEDPSEDWNNYTFKTMPKYEPERLVHLLPKIKARFKRIVDLLSTRALDDQGKAGKTKQEKQKSPITKHWMNTINKEGTISRIVGILSDPISRSATNLFLRQGKKKLVEKLANGTIETILKDLEEKELIENEQ